MEELRQKLNGPDYKEKLGVLVSDLYKLAFNTYKDIPRGPIKVFIFKISSFGLKFLSFEIDLELENENSKMNALTADLLKSICIEAKVNVFVFRIT